LHADAPEWKPLIREWFLGGEEFKAEMLEKMVHPENLSPGRDHPRIAWRCSAGNSSAMPSGTRQSASPIRRAMHSPTQTSRKTQKMRQKKSFFSLLLGRNPWY